MSHIPEGELHAYLDGSLDHLGDEASERIRAHLERCSSCRARLEDERVLRARAESLLGQTAPRRLDPPSFEELRLRALRPPESGEDGSPPATRRRGPGVPWGLAWAASILLALGVGWAGRGAFFGEARTLASAVRPEMDRRAEALEEAPTAFSEARPGVVDEQGATAEPVADATPRRVVEEERQAAAAREGAPAATERLDATVPAVQLADANRAAEAAPPSDALLRTQKPEPSAAAAPPPATPQPVGSASAGASVPAETESAPGRRAPAAEATRDATAYRQREKEEDALAVPGFEILAIEPDAGVPGQPGLRILQRLHQGDTLELRYFGLLTTGDATLGTNERERISMRDLPNPPLKAGWNQVVLRRGNGWLVARAPISKESLEFLLRVLN